jgi:hypothetical protein
VMLAANEAQRTFLDLVPKKGGGLEHLVHGCCRIAMLVSESVCCSQSSLLGV